jgi:protein TonB
MDEPAAQRAISIAAVLALHILLVALLVTQSATVRGVLLAVAPATLIPPAPAKPKIAPKIEPNLKPVLMPIPIPEINVTPPPTQNAAPRAVIRVGPQGPPVAHFGAGSGDEGLGVEAATSAGGGKRGRGSLGDFDAAVRAAILAKKHQPFLAADRRQECVINYTVTVARDGSLAGASIDPCAEPEINDAANAAIRAAAPFAPPPDLGAVTYTVHGTLIFHP